MWSSTIRTGPEISVASFILPTRPSLPFLLQQTVDPSSNFPRRPTTSTSWQVSTIASSQPVGNTYCTQQHLNSLSLVNTPGQTRKLIVPVRVVTLKLRPFFPPSSPLPPFLIIKMFSKRKLFPIFLPDIFFQLKAGKKTAVDSHSISTQPVSVPRRSLPSQTSLLPSPERIVDARQLPPSAVHQNLAANFSVPRTLSAALWMFFTHPSILLILCGLAGLVAGRFSFSGPSSSLLQIFLECSLVLFTIVGWILQEWFLHRLLLHSSFDWFGREIHAQHHALPFYHVSIDPPLIVGIWGAIACILGWVFVPQPLVWTVLGVSATQSKRITVT